MMLYDKILNITKYYLGPAAEPFLHRQITRHLKMDSSKIEPQHIGELARWCGISGALIMDKDKAKEFSQKIAAVV
jgi:Uri superfamily endonuclease